VDADRAKARRVRLIVVTELIVAALILGLAIGYVVVRVREHQDSGLGRPAGIPASVPTQLAELMRLSALPVSTAPGFTLTDQNGRSVSLASLRGKVVVLEFMDPHCTDICPIVSQEFVDAYHDLGSDASRVVFAAINVNRYHLRVADVAAFSREHELTTIPTWQFLTGSYPALRAVWHAYDIVVYAPSPNADVIHSSDIYFIDPAGKERFEASPIVDHTSKGSAYLPAVQLASWGRGIALMARQMLGR
jgi:cytochrome oxidase Cu insertion factor (SCO1/SenC/PrrC family)